MSDIAKFIKERQAGADKPSIFVLSRDNGIETIILDTFPSGDDVEKRIEEVIREDLQELSGKINYTVQAQTREGRAIGSRTYRRKGLLQGGEGGSGRLENRLVDLVGNTLERAGAIQSGIYDRMSNMLDRQERIIIAQNQTISELAQTAAESGTIGEQDEGQKFALSRIGEMAGKAMPLLGAMLAKHQQPPLAQEAGGKYAKLRAAIASFTDSDLESIGLWFHEAGTGPDVLARLSEESRNRVITVISEGGL